jgi:hypothetical protein|nr:MAG: hypothetical protein [Caudoviricetes sp.]
MKGGKVANLVDWDNEENYDELLEREREYREQIKVRKAFKRFAEPTNPKKGKVQYSRTTTRGI